MKQISKLMSIVLSVCIIIGGLSLGKVTFAYEDRRFTYADLLTKGVIQLGEINQFLIADFDLASPDALKFYGDKYKMMSIIESLKYEAENFNKFDALHIRNYLSFIDRAIMWADSYPELKYMKDQFIKDELESFYQNMFNNYCFGFGTDSQNDIMWFFFNHYFLMDKTPEQVNALVPLIRVYKENQTSFRENENSRYAYYAMLSRVNDFLMKDISKSNKAPKNSKYYKSIDPFLNELYDLVAQNILSADLESQIFNQVFKSVQELGQLHTNPKFQHSAYTSLFNRARTNQRARYMAANEIMQNFNGKDVEGKSLDMNQILKDGERIFLPKTYAFDNGKMIIKAGEDISEEKIFSLYWASKEVRAQFFNAFETDKKLAANQEKKVLNVHIYNSRYDYKLNHIFNGLDTDNGGIYSRAKDSIFTFEPFEKMDDYTSSDFLYLIEVFRHEYTHHLQFNYAIPMVDPKWNILDDERLTWFIEGGADFFQGATRTDGVIQLSKEARYLEETEDKWYDASKTLSIKYNNYVLYKYSNFLMDMLYNKRPSDFKTLKNHIQNGDVKAYKSWVGSMSKSKVFNEDYQKHMAYLKMDSHKLQKLSFNQDYLKNHEPYAFSKIVSEIQAIQPLKNLKVKTFTSKYFNTFELRGEMINKTSTVFTDVNNMLKALDEKDWSGYKTFTAYVVPKGKGYELVVHGILTCPVKEVTGYKF